MAKRKANEADVAGVKAMANLSGGRSAKTGEKGEKADTISGRVNQMGKNIGENRSGTERLKKYGPKPRASARKIE